MYNLCIIACYLCRDRLSRDSLYRSSVSIVPLYLDLEPVYLVWDPQAVVEAGAASEAVVQRLVVSVVAAVRRRGLDATCNAQG